MRSLNSVIAFLVCQELLKTASVVILTQQRTETRCR